MDTVLLLNHFEKQNEANITSSIVNF